MDNATARVIGGIYMALSAALSSEGKRLANDVLFDLAESPNVNGNDARIYRAIAETASGEPLPERQDFAVISGGLAS